METNFIYVMQLKPDEMPESVRRELKENATQSKYRLVNAFRIKDPGLYALF